MYDDEPAYTDQRYEDEPAPRRSRLVPILAIIAALLAIVVGIAIVLFALGAFDDDGGTRITDSQPARVTATTPAQPAPVQTSIPRAAVSIAPPTQDLPPLRSSHGDWQLRCDTPAGALNEQCFLMQFVTAEDRENVGLIVIVLKTADGQAQLLRVVAPLGVFLPRGLGLRIDAEDFGGVSFVRCTPRGCVAEVILEENLLQQLRNGNVATFVIFQTPEEGVGIPIALAGFGPGYASLP